jgi:hypothetical protein
MKIKTTFTLVAALALCISVRAVNSELNISSADQSKFVVTVDNFYFGTPASTFNITNLDEGYHRLRIARQGVLVNGRSSVPMEQLYDGYVNVPADARVSAVTGGAGILNIASIVSLLPAWGNSNGTGICTCGHCNNGGSNNGGYGNNGWFPPVPQGMAQADFDALKATIASKGFESTKLTIAAQALQSNKVTARQVKEIMDLMSFESTKVQIAKYAYGKVIDRQNYYLVNDAFAFSSSSDELTKYITAFQG